MSHRRARWMVHGMAAAFAAIAGVGAPAGAAGAIRLAAAAQRPVVSSTPADAPYRALVSTYCVSCHNSKVKAGKPRARRDQYSRIWPRITKRGKKSFASCARTRCRRRAPGSPIKRHTPPR